MPGIRPKTTVEELKEEGEMKDRRETEGNINEGARLPGRQVRGRKEMQNCIKNRMKLVNE